MGPDNFLWVTEKTGKRVVRVNPAGSGGLADWRNVLAMTSLKNGSVYVLRLTGDGGSVQGDVTQFFKTTNRYRDLALRPDGRALYVITDSSGLANAARTGIGTRRCSPLSGYRPGFTPEGWVRVRTGQPTGRGRLSRTP